MPTFLNRTKGRSKKSLDAEREALIAKDPKRMPLSGKEALKVLAATN